MKPRSTSSPKISELGTKLAGFSELIDFLIDIVTRNCERRNSRRRRVDLSIPGHGQHEGMDQRVGSVCRREASRTPRLKTIFGTAALHYQRYVLLCLTAVRQLYCLSERQDGRSCSVDDIAQTRHQVSPSADDLWIIR